MVAAGDGLGMVGREGKLGTLGSCRRMRMGWGRGGCARAALAVNARGPLFTSFSGVMDARITGLVLSMTLGSFLLTLGSSL